MKRKLRVKHLTTGRWSVAMTLIWLGFLGLSANGQARLHVDVAERERWYGEDNLYGEQYGRRIAMHGDWMVTAGRTQAVVWEWNRDQDRWRFYQHIDLGISTAFGDIADVAISKRHLVFGVPRTHYTLAGPHTGRVFVYRRTAVEAFTVKWVLDDVIIEPPSHVIGYETHAFGSSVAIADYFDSPPFSVDVLLVGAPDSRECCSGNVDGPGFVFVYVWDGTGWYLGDYIQGDLAWQHFGASLDFANNFPDSMFVVGAPRSYSAGPGEYGAAYVYFGSGDQSELGWRQETAIWPLRVGPFDDGGFARHVALNRILAAPEVAVGFDGGVLLAYRFLNESWLAPEFPLPGRRMEAGGDGLAFDGNRLLYPDADTDEVLSIRKFNNEWMFDGVLESTTTERVRGLGITSTNGKRFAVGYPFEDRAGPNTGLVQTHRPGFPLQELTYGEAEQGDRFGFAIAAGPGLGGAAHAVVGAPGDLRPRLLGDHPRPPDGAVYLYDYDPQQNIWIKAERWQPVLPSNVSFGVVVAYGGLGRFAATVGSHAGESQVLVRHPRFAETRLDSLEFLDAFGASLAYGGERLLVGASRGHGMHPSTGVVYTYGSSPEKLAFLRRFGTKWTPALGRLNQRCSKTLGLIGQESNGVRTEYSDLLPVVSNEGGPSQRGRGVQAGHGAAGAGPSLSPALSRVRTGGAARPLPHA